MRGRGSPAEATHEDAHLTVYCHMILFCHMKRKRNVPPPCYSPAGKVLTHLILDIFRLNGSLLAAGNELTRDLGSSSARWQVMGALAAAPLPAAQIARNMGLTRQSVQRVVDVLAEQGLVTFAENPYHQRAQLVRLTAQGGHLLQEITRRQVQWVNALAQGLSAPEVQAVAQLIGLVRQRLETPDRKEPNHGHHRAHQPI
jgi:DNA-binding MarR family transcriptional regulator